MTGWTEKMPDGYSDTNTGSGGGVKLGEVDMMVRREMAVHMRYDHKFSLSKIQGILRLSRKELKYLIGE